MSTTDPTEEARAALWRDQQANRVAFKSNLWLELQAPPEPRQQVLEDWSPIVLANLEAQNPTDPEEDP